MGDERFGIDLTFRDKAQRFFTIAAVHAAGLEGEVFCRTFPAAAGRGRIRAEPIHR